MQNYIYEVKKIKHYYNDKKVLDIDKFLISQGSIIGLVGPNGSGKSTLLKLLGFIQAPTFGEIKFKGKIEKPFSNSIRFKTTLVTQEPYLMKRSVGQNIAYGLKLKKEIKNLKDRIIKALFMVGLEDEFIKRKWYELSVGEAQRVALAARLILKPKVLLLDEPTANVDANSINLIKTASLKAKKEWGTTLVIASHDFKWLYSICDNIFHLIKGKLFESAYNNLFFGPWQKRKDGYWQKILPEKEELIVSRPPKKDSIALISPESITISKQKYLNKASQISLHGIISSMILDNRSNKILITVVYGNMSFTAKVSQESVQDNNFQPGKNVFIYYNIDSVIWC